MSNKRVFQSFSGLILGAALLSGSAGALVRQPASPQAAPKRRTTPVYATAKDGTPAAGLTAADLEVKLAGSPISDFTLTKGGSTNKLVFLVFDTASLSSNLLSKSKKIAVSSVAVSSVALAGDSARFVVMSIDPGAGLRPICGPTTDKALVTKTIGKSISSKSDSNLRALATDSSSFVDTRQAYRIGAQGAPMALATRGMDYRDVERQDRQVGTILITSLRTLDAVIGRFPESDKVVQLYSSGIPQLATLNHSSINQATVPTFSTSPTWVVSAEPGSADSVTLDEIRSLGQGVKKSGALLFAVDMAGTRIGEDSTASGERSLRMLVNESGGRFFKGSDKDIIDSLSGIEQGYYELSFPLPQEIQGASISLEVRAKNPDITLTSVSSLAKARSFAEMTDAEKQSAIMAVLSNGLVGDIGLEVSTVPVDVSGNGEEARLSVQLPVELSHAEWDIYRVWMDTSMGTFQIEKEHVLSESPMLTFSVAGRKDTIQDAVLVQAKSGTVLVCRGKGKPKSRSFRGGPPPPRSDRLGSPGYRLGQFLPAVQDRRPQPRPGQPSLRLTLGRVKYYDC